MSDPLHYAINTANSRRTHGMPGPVQPCRLSQADIDRQRRQQIKQTATCTAEYITYTQTPELLCQRIDELYARRVGGSDLATAFK